MFCRFVTKGGHHIGNTRRGEDTPQVAHMREAHGSHVDSLTFRAIELVKESWGWGAGFGTRDF